MSAPADDRDGIESPVSIPSAGAELATGASMSALMFAIASTEQLDWPVATVLVVGAAASLAAALALARRARRPRSRRIVRRNDHVVVDGRAHLDVREVAAIELAAVDGNQVRVRLADCDERVRLEVRTDSIDAANRVLEVLGLTDTRVRDLAPSLGLAISRRTHQVLAAALFASFVYAIVAGPSGAIGGLAAWPWTGMQPLVRAGRDGVRIRLWWRTRFVSYRDIVAVERDGQAVRLRLVDGSAVDAVRPPRFGKLVEAYPVVVAREIERARVAFRADEPEHRALASLLSRAERSDPAWRDELAALARGADYRTPAPTRSALQAVLDDASADPSARVGAAIALRARTSAGPGDRDALRDVAARVAHPQVRIALEALAEDDEDAIEQSLRALR